MAVLHSLIVFLEIGAGAPILRFLRSESSQWQFHVLETPRTTEICTVISHLTKKLGITPLGTLKTNFAP